MKRESCRMNLKKKRKLTFSRLKDEFQLINKIDIGSYNRKFVEKENYTVVDITYFIFILISCLLFLNAIFILVDVKHAVLNILLLIPFCLFIIIPVKELLRALIFLAFGARNLQLKNKRAYLLTCIAPVVRDKFLQLLLSSVPLLFINTLLIIGFYMFPNFRLMVSGTLIVYLLYSSYDVEVISIFIMNWKKKIYSYFDSENRLLIFTQ